MANKEGIDVNPDLVEVYQHRKGQWNAACYVHEKIGHDAIDVALVENPDAELMIHPECGCASSCLYKVQSGEIPHGKAYFLSTEGMVERARVSPVKRFIVATEKGMVYRLRKEIPEKEFVPVSYKAECGYMKANTFEKIIESLKRDRIRIILCDDCCDPMNPHQDENSVHISKSVALRTRRGIENMFSVW